MRQVAKIAIIVLYFIQILALHREPLDRYWEQAHEAETDKNITQKLLGGLKAVIRVDLAAVSWSGRRLLLAEKMPVGGYGWDVESGGPELEHEHPTEKKKSHWIVTRAKRARLAARRHWHNLWHDIKRATMPITTLGREGRLRASVPFRARRLIMMPGGC